MYKSRVLEMSSNGTPQPHDVASTQFVGYGKYGIVVKDNKYLNQQVTKIGKDKERMLTWYFPREYCLNLEVNSPYITKVFPFVNCLELKTDKECKNNIDYCDPIYEYPEWYTTRLSTEKKPLKKKPKKKFTECVFKLSDPISTFEPWEVDIAEWNNYLDYKGGMMKKYKFTDASDHKPNTRYFLPSFNLKHCEEFPWKVLKEKNFGQEHTILIHMTYALHHIHQVSGITLQDINDGNLMLCDKQLTYSDLGFARILHNDYMGVEGGTALYFPPWKDAISLFNNEKYNYKLPSEWESNFSSEIEKGASDYWGIAILFMTKMCTIENDDIEERFYDMKGLFLGDLKQSFIRALYKNISPEDKIIELMNGYIKKIKELLNESNNCKNDNILERLLVLSPEERLTNADDLYEEFVAKKEE